MDVLRHSLLFSRRTYSILGQNSLQIPLSSSYAERPSSISKELSLANETCLLLVASLPSLSLYVLQSWHTVCDTPLLYRLFLPRTCLSFTLSFNSLLDITTLLEYIHRSGITLASYGSSEDLHAWRFRKSRLSHTSKLPSRV